jgi:hypothetical protein
MAAGSAASHAGSAEPNALAAVLCTSLLDVHVDILELGVPFEFSRRDFRLEGIEPVVNCIPLLRGDEPGVREHGRVRLAAGDVERREPPIE